MRIDRRLVQNDKSEGDWVRAFLLFQADSWADDGADALLAVPLPRFDGRSLTLPSGGAEQLAGPIRGRAKARIKDELGEVGS